MAIDLSKFITRFIEEARDHLQKINEGLSQLEQTPNEMETIHTIFRSAHTIKGSSRMLKLNTINELAHKMEDLLGGLRDESLTFSQDMAQLLFQGLDQLSQMVNQLDQNKNPAEVPEANPELMQALSDCFANTQPASDTNAAPNNSENPAATQAENTASSPAETTRPGDSNPQITTPASKQEATQKPTEQAPASAQTPVLKATDTVRVRLNKLDDLLSLMGEVVSSHSRLRQRLVESLHLERELTNQQNPLARQIHQFNLALKDDVQMQETQMNELLDKSLIMRMLPLSIVFDPAAHLTRDFAASVGKQISIQISGAEIELDRQLIDHLSDPIIHLIRNAVDHGIESKAERLAQGKPAHGTIQLSAHQDAGWVVVSISDDGAGIALSAVLDKAIKKSLVTPEKAATLDEQAIIDFIFMPGFSTNQIITDLSGRGVGMDVVKRTIVENLQGRIQVKTQAGKGTRITLRLPITLAIMRILIVQAGGYNWGFTAQYTSELIRVAKNSLLTVAERQTIILRNEFVPVTQLTDIISDRLPTKNNEELHSNLVPDDYLLLVLNIHGEKLALIVDSLVDERDMVIKPLPPHMQNIARVSGMVITGKNELVNILHGPALLTLARQSRYKDTQKAAKTNAQNNEQGPLHHILIVDDSLNTREIEKDVLEAHGYQVTLAEDGLDGLRKAKQMDFDAILTDVEMPNMDGFTLTTMLRQEEKYQYKPIIIITSREKEEDKRRGIQVGADAYIVKGDFDQTNLVDTLRALLA